MRRPFIFPVFAGAVFFSLLGCNQPTNNSAAPTGSTPAASASAATDQDVLATVNGVPIRVADLQYVLAMDKDAKRGKGVDKEKAKEALEKIVDQELARQQAEAKGLNTDPEYLRKLRFMQAPVNDFERKTLTEAFFRAQGKQAEVTEAEARKYFADNRAKFQTELHVLQILIRNDSAKTRQLKEELDGGATFEEVAAKQFPGKLPVDARAPWDMGMLRWSQVPTVWEQTLAKMKDGDVSGIIRGPKNREWIIKLVKRQQNEAITFEQVRSELTNLLKARRAAELAQKTAKSLRDKGTIVYVQKPGEMPPPPDP